MIADILAANDEECEHLRDIKEYQQMCKIIRTHIHGQLEFATKK